MARTFVMIGLLWSVAGIGAARGQMVDSLAGVQVRFNGDVVVPADRREQLVLVVGGDALVEGQVEVLVVVNGTARLVGARVKDLAVLGGGAELSRGAVVSGDVHLVDGEIQLDSGSSVAGRIDRGYTREVMHGLGLVAAMVAVGLAVAMLVAGLVAAAVAAGPVRHAGAALTAMPGATALAALAVWVGLPIAAGLLIATVIGIPTALGLLVFALPALGFIGFLVTGIRLGDWVVERARGRIERAHPYLAALMGLTLLLLAGWLPVIGGVVTLLAGIAGGGAVALVAWTAARSKPAPVGPPSERAVPVAGATM